MKTSVLLLPVVILLGTGCQSAPPDAQARRTMFIAGPSQGGRFLPRSKFIKGESPVIYLAGYDNQTVLLEVTRNGGPPIQQEFTVPGRKTYQQDGGVGVVNHFGAIRQVRRTEFVTTSGDAAITFNPGGLGFYQVTLKLNGVAVESAGFSVLASMTP